MARGRREKEQKGCRGQSDGREWATHETRLITRPYEFTTHSLLLSSSPSPCCFSPSAVTLPTFHVCTECTDRHTHTHMWRRSIPPSIPVLTVCTLFSPALAQFYSFNKIVILSSCPLSSSDNDDAAAPLLSLDHTVSFFLRLFLL